MFSKLVTDVFMAWENMSTPALQAIADEVRMSHVEQEPRFL